MAAKISPHTKTTQEWSLASASLRNAYSDFVLAHEAAGYAQATHHFYRYTTGLFLPWLERHGVTSPEDVSARHVREYLAELAGRGKTDTTVYDHARAIRTLLRFWLAEGYMTSAVALATPRVAKKRLPVLAAAQVQTIVKACRNPRDRAIVLFMVDSGLRREEVCRLNWEDVDIGSGLVKVKRGKGGKARSAVIGATSRRALLAYRRTLTDIREDTPLFQSRGAKRFGGPGLLRVFQRLSKQTGIRVTPHALRRTFVILSLRAEMDVLHLQALLGHSSLDMTMHYAQMVDEDLLTSHKAHSPIDNLERLAKQ